MTASDVKEALKGRGEDFARWLFPAGRKNGNEWLIGSLSGEAGRSLSISIGGSKSGVFCDFATSEAGDNFIELYAQAKRVEFSQALRDCATWLGVSLHAPVQLPQPAPSAKLQRDPQPPQRIPDPVREAWFEGAEYLLARPHLAAKLAEARGWPAEFGHYLASCAAISMPKHGDERGVAFLVVAPRGERGSMTTIDVGYHIRLKGRAGEKCSWRYVPNTKQHEQSIPALPFIIGRLDTARLLVIAEGQWDALTFALAAGWLGNDCEVPHGVCLIGIRGVSGVEPFLQHYRKFWPRGADCLVLADNDEPGKRWHEGERSFAAELSKHCRKVAVVACDAKDFNDLYKAQPITPADVQELLASHGMALSTEVAA